MAMILVTVFNRRLFITKILRHMYLMKRKVSRKKSKKGKHQNEHDSSQEDSSLNESEIGIINFKFSDKFGVIKQVFVMVFCC